jgi:hypothetical protein
MSSTEAPWLSTTDRSAFSERFKRYRAQERPALQVETRTGILDEEYSIIQRHENIVDPTQAVLGQRYQGVRVPAAFQVAPTSAPTDSLRLHVLIPAAAAGAEAAKSAEEKGRTRAEIAIEAATSAASKAL